MATTSPSLALPTPGSLFHIIRRENGVTRADLGRLTGISRASISQRVDRLIESGLVREASDQPSGGGRPPSSLVFASDIGVVLSADLGATHARLAVTDLAGNLLAELAEDLDISSGPAILDTVEDQFGELLRRAGRRPEEVHGIGVGVPGPVEFEAGRPVNPPLMPGWDGYSIPDRLRRGFDVPILVDNDVNIMAVGEYFTTWSTKRDLLFVKVGTGIGCGIITEGEIYRGAHGAAGDIGHIRVVAEKETVCKCGNVNCLEAIAGGAAVARAARELGCEAENSREVVELARAHQPEVVQLVRESGRVLGTVLAGLVNAFNPNVIVIGGDMADAHEQLFAGVREVVYQRATPLATRHLEIIPSALGDRAGTTGAAVLAIEHVLQPQFIDEHWVGRRAKGASPRKRAAGKRAVAKSSAA
ncbi:MAG: ROK family protein [Solirubrobacterales bacterium]